MKDFSEIVGNTKIEGENFKLVGDDQKQGSSEILADENRNFLPKRGNKKKF